MMVTLVKDVFVYCVYLVVTATLADCIQVTTSRNNQEVQCEKSRIDHNVTLASGHHAGSFLKANKSIVTMRRCLQQCCQMHGCDVAFFSNGACYSVKCTSLDTCAPSMNLDKRMMIAISYVAKPKVTSNHLSTDKNVELEVTDNLIAEVTSESPFLDDDNIEGNPVQIKKHSRWKETKDAVVAVVCGCVAVAVGVVGVIVMTRQLVDEDEPFPVRSCYPPSATISRHTKETLPTISESDDECEVANHITDIKNVLTSKNEYLMKLPTIDEGE